LAVVVRSVTFTCEEEIALLLPVKPHQRQTAGLKQGLKQWGLLEGVFLGINY